jgi:hypothetical protein
MRSTQEELQTTDCSPSSAFSMTPYGASKSKPPTAQQAADQWQWRKEHRELKDYPAAWVG